MLDKQEDWLDAQFIEIESDAQYRDLLLEIVQEFERADQESLHASILDREIGETQS